MVKAFIFLAGLPVLPFRPNDKIDIVNVDFVADAVATLHMKLQPQHDTYHLSSGTASQTFRELTTALAAARKQRGPLFVPFLERPFSGGVNSLANPAKFHWPRRCAHEGIHAVPGLEYGVRQQPRNVRAGSRPGSIFALQLSAPEIQPGDELHI